MTPDPLSTSDGPRLVADAERALLPGDLGVLLEQMRGAKVAVAGDFCLDAYWHLDEGLGEDSIETGLAVRRVATQRYSPGGAGNVVANLLAMGVGQVRAIGAFGADPFGRTLVQLLSDLGADTTGMLDLGRQWQTAVYAKPYLGATEQNRLDFGAREPFPGQALRRFQEVLESAADWADVVVVNQQVEGAFTAGATVETVNSVLAARPRTVFIVDARSSAARYAGAVLKLNATEALSRLRGEERRGVPEELVIELAKQALARNGKPVFITRGERGIVAADAQGIYVVPGVEVNGEVDPVGAGDTVVAAIAAVLACKRGPRVAAYLANLAASVTVRKLRATGTAAPAELEAAAEGTNYVYAPELADVPSRARFLPGTEVEVIVERPTKVRPAHVVMDFDGTLSTLREGWDQVMERVMVESVLGDAHGAAGVDQYASVSRAASELVDRTTGAPTLVQMQGLVELVRQFGFVPGEKVLRAQEYKEIYNAELMRLVQGRLDKVRSGQLDRLDFQMKNVGKLLAAFRERGVKLYVASGSDVHGVKAEAEALGLAEFFEDRIYGAVPGSSADAKSVVLDKILGDNPVEPQAVVTIGDGPAEMREARKRGAVAVGLCSDERRRFGANLAKRRRLIRGGATIVVPDFTDIAALLAVLGL